MFGSKRSIAIRLGIALCALGLIFGVYTQLTHAAAPSTQTKLPIAYSGTLIRVPNLPGGVRGCVYSRSYIDVALISWSTPRRQYVSTEIQYTGGNYGMLRARANSIGPWEQYDIFRAGDSQHPYYAIRSRANQKLVTTEIDYTSSYNHAMLRARSASVGPWEKYYLCVDTQNNWVLISAANNLAVSIEVDYTGANFAMLRARATSIGAWEEFGLIQY